ncbi:bacillithiol system redox-active protein YtxJ [Taibaiella chishuiensis]|nr:bacillithiol system redox-active protein YtxJ [Taibaiella chishuiensis]
MNTWITITSADDIRTIIEKSAGKPQIIFKDSTTCGISAHAKSRLENGFAHIAGKADFYYLDLLALRPVSNLIAQELQVTHQSPQIIVVKNGQATYTSSHHAIDAADIARHL